MITIKINNTIYLVGSGQAGFSLTNSYDCNVYLIDCDESLVLIDAGANLEPERIVEEIKRDGFNPEKISHVLLTHGHADHSAGASFFKKKFQAKVYGGVKTADYVSNGNLKALSLHEAIGAELYPADYSYERCEVKALTNGETICVGKYTFHLLELPGHSIDHVGYVLHYDGKKALFSGDLIFKEGKISLLATWDCSITDYKHSIQKVSDLNIDQLFPGHATFLLSQAHNDVEKCRMLFDQLAIPNNF